MKSSKDMPTPRRYNQGARAQSAEATTQRIVDAFLARLMEQWFDEITLDRVAADAGVTVQTVVRKFGNKENLLAASAKTLSAQINERRASPPGDIDRLIDNLIEDYEHIGDAVIRWLALELRHTALKKTSDFGRREHREWVSTSFEKALSQLDDDARRQAVDELVIVTDVYTWKLLRRDMGRTVAEAKKAVKSLVNATMEEKSKGELS